MTNLRKFGVELKHANKCRFLEPFSTEHFINEMEDIITRTIIGRTWTRNPMESKIISKTSMVDRRPEKPVLKWYKCGSTSHLADNFTKKTKINKVQLIEEIQCSKEESDQDSAISEETPAENYTIENITDFIQVTEFHTQLPQYSENCCNLINIHEARI
ncbi:hypothetical protein O181_112318 [Austropuccinia psidii MF-1]|uniref:Uncharacterized protein n=1 Tax=Austropuccinia psidii MF-1 TaxID=1389203 RepID=A0A9Q3K097_9BASI|nr:hypothetical protein [Austropuccinia psidii MF-1]